MQYVDIVFSIDENFIKQCATVIVSILMNTNTKKRIRFHILCDSLSETSKNKLLKLKEIKEFDLLIYNISTEKIAQFPLNRSWISIATYFRLLIADVLPIDIEKCLYLDCDLICLKEIEELWNYNINNYLAGAVYDVAADLYNKKLGLPEDNEYFNAGVLLLNLKLIRSFDFLQKCLEYYNENKDRITAQDQDILNGVFSGRWLKLPLIWNICTPLYHKVSPYYQKLDFIQRKIIHENPGIVHFTSIYKPWHMFVKHTYMDKFYEYASFTPFKKEYYLICLKRLFSYIFRIEKYQQGKKYKTRDIYILNYNIFSFYRCKFVVKIIFFNIIKYVKLKNRYKKRKFYTVNLFRKK